MGKDAKIMQQIEKEWQRHEVSPALNQLLANDRVTQRALITLAERTNALEAVRTRRFWQRLAWLIRGV